MFKKFIKKCILYIFKSHSFALQVRKYLLGGNTIYQIALRNASQNVRAVKNLDEKRHVSAFGFGCHINNVRCWQRTITQRLLHFKMSKKNCALAMRALIYFMKCALRLYTVFSIFNLKKVKEQAVGAIDENLSAR